MLSLFKKKKSLIISESMGEQLKKRIVNTGGWHIVIDDGYISYLFPLKASNKYSINTIFKKIQKSVKK